MLATSLDPATTMGQVAELTVPRLADLCVIDLRDEDGSIRDVAVAASNQGIARNLEKLRKRHQLDPDGEHPVARVIRSGDPVLLPEMTNTLLRSFAQGSEHAQFMIDHGYRSAVVAPLVARGRTLGALSVLRLGDGLPYDEEDLDLVCELARRAALAIDNARLFSDLRRVELAESLIAHTLQRSLLPESLPEIPGAEVQALHAAAGEFNEVGGDFYDVMRQGEKRWMLMIGDVCGKGPRAAGVTALARHTLRAVAMNGQSPAGMLSTLHEALRSQPLGMDLCTVCLVMLERDDEGGAMLTVALAGHPAPLLIDGNGDVREIGHYGTLLGVIDPVKIEEIRVRMQDDETLLLYTDGVSEAGAPDRPLSERGLRALCAEAPGLTLAELLEGIEVAALARTEGKLRDDIALLALRCKT
ncbi:MAG TPA: GAF domain-containing SpoIIE family protein phosphatase [Solirubrobacteraceae bacterium]|nr:GAF domain-containing SpoIIE family protein phosphatase [Solirubrobacteraceae bacterium]